MSVAGMGGPLMQRILEEGREGAERDEGADPSAAVGDTGVPPLAAAERGTALRRKRLALEEGKYYLVMRAEPRICRLGTCHILSVWKLSSGQAHPVLRKYLDQEEKTLLALQESLEKAGTEKAQERLEEVQRELQEIKEAKAYEM